VNCWGLPALEGRGVRCEGEERESGERMRRMRDERVDGTG
jgi:hypothetical protein